MSQRSLSNRRLARFGHAHDVGSVTCGKRPFDPIANQFARNGDSAKRIVMKVAVAGAEWDSVLTAPDETLPQIDQLAVEFHGIREGRSVATTTRVALAA